MENKYYLAIETNHHSYFPINLQELKINYNLNDLKDLDTFTIKYTKQEIIDSIKKANLIEVNNQEDIVVILKENNNIRKLPILTKDNSFDFLKYLEDNYSKDLKNKVINFLNNKTDNKYIIELKEVNNLEEFLNIINSLPYIILRKLYFYLNEKL